MSKEDDSICSYMTIYLLSKEMNTPLVFVMHVSTLSYGQNWSSDTDPEVLLPKPLQFESLINEM